MDANGNKILIKVAAFWSIFKVVEKFIRVELLFRGSIWVEHRPSELDEAGWMLS